MMGTYVCMYVCVYVNTCKDACFNFIVRHYEAVHHSNTYIHTHTHTYKYTCHRLEGDRHLMAVGAPFADSLCHTYIHTFTHAQIHTNTYMHTHTYIHIHAYTYMHTHTCTYTYMHIHLRHRLEGDRHLMAVGAPFADSHSYCVTYDARGKTCNTWQTPLYQSGMFVCVYVYISVCMYVLCNICCKRKNMQRVADPLCQSGMCVCVCMCIYLYVCTYCVKTCNAWQTPLYQSGMFVCAYMYIFVCMYVLCDIC
jgi:hypothetical protein